METRKRAWIVALSLVLASSGIAWAAPADRDDRGQSAAGGWEWIWTELTGLLGVDGAEPRSVGAKGQSEQQRAAPKPAPAPPSTDTEGDKGGGLDPNG